MNIFALHRYPRVAAQYHCDKHVVKMILESTQMLSTVLHQYGDAAPYKPTHRNHPCTMWVARSADNFEWLHQMALELCSEYTLRYGKVHACQSILERLHTPSAQQYIGLTMFAQAMPVEYMVRNDAVQAYRNYYLHAKGRMAKWERGTPAPEWWSYE